MSALIPNVKGPVDGEREKVWDVIGGTIEECISIGRHRQDIVKGMLFIYQKVSGDKNIVPLKAADYAFFLFMLSSSYQNTLY